MPLYDYICTDCGNQEEDFADWKDRTPLTCECGGKMVRQIPTAGLTGLSDNVTSRCGKSRQHGHDECVFERPDPVKDCALQFKAIEKAGKMTPQMRKFANQKMAGLRKKEAMGKIQKIDYAKVGHPTEGKISKAKWEDG